jgi:hypothetical protein
MEAVSFFLESGTVPIFRTTPFRILENSTLVFAAVNISYLIVLGFFFAGCKI